MPWHFRVHGSPQKDAAAHGCISWTRNRRLTTVCVTAKDLYRPHIVLSVLYLTRIDQNQCPLPTDTTKNMYDKNDFGSSERE